MRKLTQKMKDRIANDGAIVRNWDDGAHLIVNMDWDTDEYIISANEVLREFKQYVKKWPSIKKFKMEQPQVWIDYVR